MWESCHVVQLWKPEADQKVERRWLKDDVSAGGQKWRFGGDMVAFIKFTREKSQFLTAWYSEDKGEFCFC